MLMASYAHHSLASVASAARGRHILARANISALTRIIEAYPIAAVPDDACLSSHCSVCLRSLSGLAEVCAGSDECRSGFTSSEQQGTSLQGEDRLEITEPASLATSSLPLTFSNECNEGLRRCSKFCKGRAIFCSYTCATAAKFYHMASGECHLLAHPQIETFPSLGGLRDLRLGLRLILCATKLECNSKQLWCHDLNVCNDDDSEVTNEDARECRVFGLASNKLAFEKICNYGSIKDNGFKRVGEPRTIDDIQRMAHEIRQAALTMGMFTELAEDSSLGLAGNAEVNSCTKNEHCFRGNCGKPDSVDIQEQLTGNNKREQRNGPARTAVDFDVIDNHGNSMPNVMSETEVSGKLKSADVLSRAEEALLYVLTNAVEVCLGEASVSTCFSTCGCQATTSNLPITVDSGLCTGLEAYEHKSGHSSPVGCSIYPPPFSWLNHSCRPNAFYKFCTMHPQGSFGSSAVVMDPSRNSQQARVNESNLQESSATFQTFPESGVCFADLSSGTTLSGPAHSWSSEESGSAKASSIEFPLVVPTGNQTNILSVLAQAVHEAAAAAGVPTNFNVSKFLSDSINKDSAITEAAPDKVTAGYNLQLWGSIKHNVMYPPNAKELYQASHRVTGKRRREGVGEETLPHSCEGGDARAGPTSRGPGPVVVVQTLRDISEGEEICITYTDLLQPKRQRQTALLSRYLFTCSCLRCQVPQSAASDYFLAAIGRCSAVSCNGWLVSNDDDVTRETEETQSEKVSICSLCGKHSDSTQERLGSLEAALSQAVEMVAAASSSEIQESCRLLEAALFQALRGGRTEGFHATSEARTSEVRGSYSSGEPSFVELQRASIRAPTSRVWQGLHPWHRTCLDAYTVLASMLRLTAAEMKASDNMEAKDTGMPLTARIVAKSGAAYSILLSAAAEHLLAAGELGLAFEASAYWQMTAQDLQQLLASLREINGKQANSLLMEEFLIPRLSEGVGEAQERRSRLAEKLGGVWPFLVRESPFWRGVPCPLGSEWQEMLGFAREGRKRSL